MADRGRKLLRPCLTPGCGRLSDASRCPTHRKTTARGLGRQHQLAAKALLAHATVCHWCGRPPTPGNPLTADHLIPRSRGGAGGPLVAACLRCNSSRGDRW